jgi:hypothetical protein
VCNNREIVLKIRLKEVAGNMTNPELEEKLREAACFGDIEGVKVSSPPLPRVADPDWIRIQSGQWIRIRNRIQEGKNDPQK